MNGRSKSKAHLLCEKTILTLGVSSAATLSGGAAVTGTLDSTGNFEVGAAGDRKFTVVRSSTRVRVFAPLFIQDQARRRPYDRGLCGQTFGGERP